MSLAPLASEIGDPRCTWHNALGTMQLAQCTWHDAFDTMHLARCWHNTLGTMHWTQYPLGTVHWQNALDTMHLAVCGTMRLGTVHLVSTTWHRYNALGTMHLACTWRNALAHRVTCILPSASIQVHGAKCIVPSALCQVYCAKCIPSVCAKCIAPNALRTLHWAQYSLGAVHLTECTWYVVVLRMRLFTASVAEVASPVVSG